MDELDETVLNIQQRQKRGLIMRRYRAKIERSKELSQKRLAPEKNIKKRAYAQARQIVRKRVAGSRGAEYEKLGPSEKMAIDRAIDKKAKAIKKLALRLIPKVKQAEQKRLHSFMKGQSIHNFGKPEGHHTEPTTGDKASPGSAVSEELNLLFAEAFTSNETEVDQTGDAQDTQFKNKKKKKDDCSCDDTKTTGKGSQIKMYNKFGEEREQDTLNYLALTKKAEKSGVDIETLGEVYDRGLEAWKEGYNVSPTQYAFARVNSFINKGKTYYTDDADLQEGRLSFSEKMEETKYVEEGIRKTPWNMGKSMSHFRELGSDNDGPVNEEIQIDELSAMTVNAARRGIEKKVGMDPGMETKKKERHLKSFSTGTHKILGLAKVNATEEVQVDESNNTPYVKPHIEKGSTKQSGWKASNKHGRVKYFGMDFKKSAEKHAGISEETQIDEVDISKFKMRIAKPKTDSAPKKTFMSVIDELDIPAKHLNNARSVWNRTKDVEAVRKFISNVKEETEAVGTKVRKNTEIVDRKPKTPGVYTKQAEVKTKIIDEEGNATIDPKDRLVGTDSLVKTYKKDTPGQGGDLNESFNIAFAAGVGVSLTAADLGMKAQGGFALHPSVIEEMEARDLEEDAVSAEKKPVYQGPRRKADGSYTPAKTVMRKSGRKIIDVEEPEDADKDEHDGK